MTGRRDRRGGRTPSLPRDRVNAAFRALFQGAGAARDFWFDADQATSTVATDYMDPTHALTVVSGVLAAPANDPLFPTNCKTLAYTGTQQATGGRAASAYNFMIDGTGCTYIDVFAPTSLAATQIFSSAGASATGSVVQGALATSGLPILQVTNDAGAGIISNTAAPALAVNTPTFMAYTQLSTAWVKYVKSTVSASGTSGAPGTTTTLPLRIASQSGGAFPASMKWRGSYGFHRVLTAAEWSVVNAKILIDSGVS
jgi:hypothetical protein